MSKQSLLLVDGDARSLRVLEVSLRKAGFTVTTATNGQDALDKLALAVPDLVISETKLEEMDGFELCKRLKANPVWVDIPFVFLTAQTAIEHKVKGLELGVDDYLTKPIYIKEVVTRLQILLQKRQRTRIEERRDGRTRFVGRLTDMAVVDLIQTIEISRKSGVIQFTGEAGRQAAIYFRDGKVIDAEAGPLQGEDAVYRLLTWNDGAFEVVFRTVRRRDAITTPSQGLLMEGMRRLDEWTRLCEQLPSLETRFEVDTRELTQRLGDIPDENNTILKLMDGRRTLTEVIDACSVGDLECLQAVSRLYFEGLLVEANEGRPVEIERRSISAQMRTEDSSQWIVPATVFDETPVQAEGIVVGNRGSGQPAVPRVVAVPTPGREGSGPRTVPPPPPPGRKATGTGVPFPVVRTDSESGRVVATTVTESGRFAAPPADDAAQAAAEQAAQAAQAAAAQAAAAQAEVASVLEGLEEAGSRAPTRPHAVPELRVSSPSGSIEVGVLDGTFRPSGLRKIDEAVLAAQAIAPELFLDDDMPTLPALAPAPASDVLEARISAAEAFAEEPSYVFEGGLGPIPEEYIDDESSSGGAGLAAELGAAPMGVDAITAADGQVRATRPETSGARVLASHGADQAEVSGELPLRSADWPEKETTQRELVTIKPRRITREMPAVVPSDDLLAEMNASEASTAMPVSSGGTSAEIAAVKPPLAATTTAVERPRPPSRPPRTGSGTSRTLQVPSSVGWTPWIFAAVGVALIASAYVRCRHNSHAPVIARVTHDASLAAPVDAARVAAGTGDAPAPPDATQVVLADVDAAPAGRPDAHAVDAAAVRVTDGPTTPGYREFRDAAAEALADNDPEAALELADKSLALHKSARTFLIKADALRRLDRTDDALAQVDLALALGDSYAPAWEIKGRILWGARRTDEAKVAFERYLALRPTGSTADRIRTLIGP